ncbi:MAG: restriction endonuclease [Butyrivibrio sp.]|nr:restriction endonuclease [Butyrivibrio sp.]
MFKEQIIFFLIGAAVVLTAALILYLIKKHKDKPLPMDEMEGHDFEYYCADLLKNQGFLEVEVTKGSGDFGADILAEKDGVTYAFQCKCYDKPIGVKAIQEIYAGRDYYGRMVGVVMTNQYFTQPAVELAKKLNIMLWDRGYLDNMES